MTGKAHIEIVILHGWSINPQNEAKWQVFRDSLKELGVSTHFLAIPGLSSPLDRAWTLPDYADWLETQLKGQQEVVLLGHSFGGQLATYYAAHHPSQIAKLILIAASGMRSQTWPSRLKRQLFKSLAKLGKTIFPPQSKRWLYWLARAQDYYQADPIMRQTMINVIGVEVGAEAAQLAIPTLLIWGDQDRETPLWIANRYHRLIKSSSLVLIAGARHAPQFTQAAETAKQVWSWLQRN